MKKVLWIFASLVILFLVAIPQVKEQARAEGLISIDTEKKYKGMSASFAKGYVPSISKNTMLLIVPFQTNVPLVNNSLYVGVSFEQEENTPFLFKNYQKRVKKTGKGVYLYQCKIKLRKDRINGQYPLYLSVRAQTAAVHSENASLASDNNMETQSETIQQDFTIYVEITDGKNMQVAEAESENTCGNTPMSSGNDEESPSGDPSTISDDHEEIIRQPRIMLTVNSLQAESPSEDTSLTSSNNKAKIQAGSSAFWTVSAKNFSSTQPIENIKVTLLSDTGSLSFEKNSWYFEQINAGSTMDLSQTIAADIKALAETVPIQFQFEYEDKKGTAYCVTETAQLSITTVQQAELTDLSFPESIYESDTDFLTFQVQNTGLGMIYNARVRLEGKGLFPEREMFLGNIEAGTSSEGEIPVFAGTLNMNEAGTISNETDEKYGITTAKIFFSYEDEQGTVKEQEFQLQTTIKRPQTVELAIEEKDPETNQWWITIVFFAILALVLLNIWLYLLMKYYQKQGKDNYGRI